ncbi:helix-turn-helix domain-containing protein [Devosia sp.]|uniref:helix-turn-helix domain-containing protein n=1 Tax=Devosia sp. TaxID=1871048 RepID=UPI002AFE43C0|nr:helix-turn-helix domain-containing protein [Devosia sp.]
MKSVPTYALYGERQSRQDWLHWETIQARSRLHDYRIAPHRHDQFVQVLHLTGGHGDVWIEGIRHSLEAPSLVVVPALIVHGYAFSSDVQGIVVTLLERDLAARGPALPQAGLLTGDLAGVEAALSRLIAEADRPGPAHEAAMTAHLTLLLVALHRASGEAPGPDAASGRAYRHAQAFRLLVDSQFRQTRRLADYAGALGITQTHLNRISRQVLGTSALGVIERRLALEARRMLLFSTLSIKQIGSHLGYDDPAYFSRFATRMLGRSPSAFRREGGAQYPG